MCRTRISSLRPGLPPRTPNAAFTLIELLASIGIIVFVLSISIVAFGPALRTASVKDGARRFRVALDTSRVRAIQQRRHIRFEAQRSKESPETWVVTANAGDRTYQWYPLPDFVGVRTDAGSADIDDKLESLSITFAPDGSVIRIGVDGVLESTLPGEFFIRFQTTREAPFEERQPLCRFIRITTLTGVVRSYGDDELVDTDDSDKRLSTSSQ